MGRGFSSILLTGKPPTLSCIVVLHARGIQSSRYNAVIIVCCDSILFVNKGPPLGHQYTQLFFNVSFYFSGNLMPQDMEVLLREMKNEDRHLMRARMNEAKSSRSLDSSILFPPLKSHPLSWTAADPAKKSQDSYQSVKLSQQMKKISIHKTLSRMDSELLSVRKAALSALHEVIMSTESSSEEVYMKGNSAIKNGIYIFN